MEEALRHVHVANKQNPSHLGQFLSGIHLGPPVSTWRSCCIRFRAPLAPGCSRRAYPTQCTHLTSFLRCFSWTAPRKASSEQPRPVSAIMVLHDPLDWALEVQVVVDVLRGGDVVLYMICRKKNCCREVPHTHVKQFVHEYVPCITQDNTPPTYNMCTWYTCID